MINTSENTIEYCLYNPSGNITALVFGCYNASDRKAIADRIMLCEPGCEQVGFIYFEAENPSFVKLEMTGGEFCGNATMCASIALFSAFEGNSESFDCTAKCSGMEDELKVHIRALNDNKYLAKLFLNSTKPASGIDHEIIICDSAPDRKAAENTIKSLSGNNAKGMMFLNGRNLTPLVYVPDAGTLFWENSCASGCIAVASHLYEKRKESFEEEIFMPGGSIKIACDGIRISLEEVIEKGETKTISI